MAAQTIRDTVTMDQILALYGYKANRQGFMCCPFHGERAGSLKIYEGSRGWHCFGCGRGESVIDFVMEHENCDFRTAVIAIDKAIGLNLMDPHEDPFDADRKRRLQYWLDTLVDHMTQVCDMSIMFVERKQHENRIKYEMLCDKKSTLEGLQSLSKDDLTWLAAYDEEDDFIEYQKEKARELKEEVAAWRRKYRRAMT